MIIGELAAFGAAISWAISAILYRKALRTTKPVSANIVRCVCTSLILLVFLWFVGKAATLTSLPAYALMLAGISGVIGLGFGDTLYMVSLKLIGVARAVPLTCTYPLFTLLIAVLLQGERFVWTVVFGAIVIVLGIWLLAQEKGHADKLEGSTAFRGVIAALVTALIWAVSIAMMDLAVTLPETGTLDGALVINTMRVSGAAAFLLIASPLADRESGFLKVSWKTLVTLVCAGLVALGLGWFLLAFSFTRIPESRAVPISSVSPLFAAIAGIAFLHERVTLRNVIGSIIVVLGIYLIFIV